jgi:excisionase family DNA binding protein
VWRALQLRPGARRAGLPMLSGGADAGPAALRSGAALLTIEEVADRLRVSVPTVRWLRQEGRFAPAIRVGRRLVWDARDVDAWLDSQRESPRVA